MIELACPACRGAVEVQPGSSTCRGCGAVYPLIDGIHRFLPLARLGHFAAFLRDYTAVRHGEGRGSDDSEYFRRLPEPTPGGPIEWQWKLRRRTWATVRDKVIGHAPPSLRVVDVGAGVGWLSNRLVQLGHSPVAVDLTIDDHDGLGAARHFDRGPGVAFARFQAEMDALPFADGAADVVIFNASLHYSTNYTETLREAMRVVAPGGRIVVMETPIYRSTAAGTAMVAERHAAFAQRFGTRSDSVASIEFLTPGMLTELTESLGLRWKRHRTWYGWAWAWRPWKARLHRRRPPSRFAVLVATSGRDIGSRT